MIKKILYKLNQTNISSHLTSKKNQFNIIQLISPKQVFCIVSCKHTREVNYKKYFTLSLAFSSLDLLSRFYEFAECCHACYLFFDIFLFRIDQKKVCECMDDQWWHRKEVK